MSVRTCLLISDDMDDHQAFAEAFHEILPDVVVVAIIDQQRAFKLILSGKFTPDIIVLDLTSHESDGDSFVEQIRFSHRFAKTPFMLYGAEDDLRKFSADGIVHFPKEYDFDQLKNILKEISRSVS